MTRLISLRKKREGEGEAAALAWVDAYRLDSAIEAPVGVPSDAGMRVSPNAKPMPKSAITGIV